MTEPREPFPPAPDQAEPGKVSPTGGEAGDRQQQGAYLTTAQGVRLRDADHSLKGPGIGSQTDQVVGPDFTLGL
ncbi:MAG: hypothetical protein Q4G46_03410 [Propionibacteriaceae bacterium]|nr:hypothetical protein [Propionibacteriaceae bacterium]